MIFAVIVALCTQGPSTPGGALAHPVDAGVARPGAPVDVGAAHAGEAGAAPAAGAAPHAGEAGTAPSTTPRTSEAGTAPSTTPHTFGAGASPTTPGADPQFDMDLAPSPTPRAPDAGAASSTTPRTSEAGTSPTRPGTPAAPGTSAPLDGGTAPSTTPRTSEAGTDAIAATVHDVPSPLVFHGPTARARANNASAALTAALEAEAVEGAPDASVVVSDGVAVVSVRGRAVATLTSADSDGMTLERYAGELDTRMVSFVKEQLRRSSLQTLALHVFFSVMLGVLGLLTLRFLRGAFIRWNTELEERGPIAPLKVLGQPILSSDTLRGLLTVGLLAARLLGYVGIVAAVIAAVLGQFEATRPLLARLGGWAAAPIVNATDALVHAVPGLVLAAILLVGVRAALQFARVLLDGVAEGRVTSRLVPAARVFPVRVVVVVVVALVAAPLVVAAAFGRFGTPLETLALTAGAVILVAAVPVLASAAAGVVVLWRGAVRPGAWVEVRGIRGEVASVHLLDVVLVPEHGGTVRVPHIAFALHPVVEGGAPHAVLDVAVRRDRPLADIDKALLDAARSVADDALVELNAAYDDRVECALVVPAAKRGTKDALVRALIAAVERGAVALAPSSPGAPSSPASDLRAKDAAGPGDA